MICLDRRWLVRVRQHGILIDYCRSVAEVKQHLAALHVELADLMLLEPELVEMLRLLPRR